MGQKLDEGKKSMLYQYQYSPSCKSLNHHIPMLYLNYNVVETLLWIDLLNYHMTKYSLMHIMQIEISSCNLVKLFFMEDSPHDFSNMLDH